MLRLTSCVTCCKKAACGFSTTGSCTVAVRPSGQRSRGASAPNSDTLSCALLPWMTSESCCCATTKLKEAVQSAGVAAEGEADDRLESSAALADAPEGSLTRKEAVTMFSSACAGGGGVPPNGGE